MAAARLRVAAPRGPLAAAAAERAAGAQRFEELGPDGARAADDAGRAAPRTADAAAVPRFPKSPRAAPRPRARGDTDADRAAYAAKLWGAGERAGGGGAGMIVAGEARAWTEPLVFDTSFVHSAYNDGDAPADYLHVDFFHPDLTAAERRALRVLRDGQARWRAARAALRAELMR